MPSAPLHPPDALQLVAFVEDQLKMLEPPELMLSGTAENVSVGGLFLVRVAKTFPVNEKITVEFAIHGSKQALEARVVHEVPDMFMGVEFLNLPPKLKELIELHVATRSAP